MVITSFIFRKKKNNAVAADLHFLCYPQRPKHAQYLTYLSSIEEDYFYQDVQDGSYAATWGHGSRWVAQQLAYRSHHGASAFKLPSAVSVVCSLFVPILEPHCQH